MDATDPVEVFYDDTCPLCTRAVRWIGSPSGTPVTFAPLRSDTLIDRNVPEAIRQTDSIIVRRGDRWLTESRAVEEILRHTPGRRWLWWLMRPLPRRLKDSAYRWVARHRRLIVP